jgi:hypothetical protein
LALEIGERQEAQLIYSNLEFSPTVSVIRESIAERVRRITKHAVGLVISRDALAVDLELGATPTGASERQDSRALEGRNNS